MPTTPDNPNEDEIGADDYEELFLAEKRKLLLDHQRAKVTRMSFDSWFYKTYKRDYKPSDKAILEAYTAGATDEIENTEFLADHAEIKMAGFKARAVKLADQVQIFVLLLETVSRKAQGPENLKKFIKKILAEQG